ncbi:MAG: hypothetical protein COB98_10705 [Flavobacteriaceae bacterium]|nr:MAG: hypothetical protein COB98_10705 [Flavobacteriaceae bacterium]
MVLKKTTFLLGLLLVVSACKTTQKISYNSNHLTKSDWIVEQQAGGRVTFHDKVMEINDAKGCTV